VTGREVLPGGHALGWGLRRSVELMLAFRVEQTDPHRFYRLLAEDSLNTIRQVAEPRASLVLDIGAGPAEFAACFREAGAHYVPLDRDEQAPSLRSGGMVGSAQQLPLRDDCVDIVFSSNLLEHVPDPEGAADEMVRVAAPGGIVVLSYTNWLSPWGGHETSPFHWLGGARAVRRYERTYGRRPKNVVDENLFRVSVGQMVHWAGRRTDADTVLLRPRYLPPWFGWIVRVPVMRELVTWNLLIVLRKR
jgi:SAM-dependent methyltransferase